MSDSDAPFDPLEFLRIADSLGEDDADEAMLRTAIGRAYYAVFLLARARTSVEGRRFAHERVRSELSPLNDRLASLLGTLSSLRLIADYELVPTDPQRRNWANNWEIARRAAQSIIDELRKLP